MNQLSPSHRGDRTAPQLMWANARKALRPRTAGVVYAQIALVIALCIGASALGKPAYLGSTNVANILDQAAPVGILVIFMTVTLVGGNFDLSVGSIAAFSAITSLMVVDRSGFLVAAIVAIGSGLVFGLINGLIVEFLKVNAFIVTLGTQLAIRGLVLIITNGNSEGASSDAALNAFNSFANVFIRVNLLFVLAGVLIVVGLLQYIARRDRHSAGRRSLRSRRPFALPGVGVIVAIVGIAVPANVSWTTQVWYMLILAAIVWLVMRYTVLGRRMYAVGSNPEAARLSGIAVKRYRLMTFVLNGGAAGFVGLLFAARLSSANPTAETGLELTVITAAILGGTSLFGGYGSIGLSVIGAIFLATIANGFNVLNLGSNYQNLIQGVVLIAAAATYTTSVTRKRNSREVNAAPPPDAGQEGGVTPPVFVADGQIDAH